MQLCDLDKPIVLVGPMGAGKTTVGRALAARLKRDFFDTDEVLLREEACSMAELLDQRGEPYFRERETEILNTLLSKRTSVVATGGGIVLKEENRTILKKEGFVIYLSLSLSTQMERLAQDKERPFLQVPNREEVLQNLTQKRLPHYEDLADLKLVVDGLSIEKIIQEVTPLN